MIKILFSVFLTVLLTGCCTPKIEYVPVTKTVLIAPDDDMLDKCELQEPPDPKAYREASADEKELMLTRAFVGASGKTILCNTRWDKLREWKRKQKAALEAKQSEKK